MKIPAVGRIQWVVLLWGVLVGAVATAEPAWDRNIIVFDDYPGNEGPWRQDDRIRKFFHKDYPDDLQVRFPVARGKIPNEIMWVTVAYETELAIQSFQAAVALRPDDLPGNMSLLAEYSVAVHSPDMKPKDRWEAAYLQQLEFIKSHDEIWSRVKDGLMVMFDEKTGATAKARTPEEVERGKQFGFGILRWKQR